MAPLAFAMQFAPTDGYNQLEGGIKDILDYRISAKELYGKFTRFMIDSMNNLDILSRDGRYDGVEKDDDLSLPSWIPPFHVAGISSFIDDILFTRFDAAKHLGARRRHEGRREVPYNAGTS
jgi:hypothetical protein